MHKPALQIQGLTAGYGQGEVISDISLNVSAGEVVALIGRNGAGKSTTMKAIVGLVRVSKGGVSLEGETLTGCPTHQIALSGIAYVPEERRIFPRLTVDENLRVTRHGQQERVWPLERIYETFPTLARLRKNLGAEMSGGEQQMLAIARALAGDPRVILLDEPSEGLAPLIVEELAQLILTLKRQGLAILVSEQNLSFANAVSDQACVIDRGVICFSGSYSAFASDPSLTRTYFSAGPLTTQH